MLRRLTLALALVVVTGLAVIATAGAGRSTSVQISWVMVGQGATNPPSADIVLPSCGGVPAGTWLRGAGTWTFFSPSGAAGNIQSMAHGTASDSGGNSYTWNYHQSVQPLPDGAHSKVVDDFVVSGSGRASNPSMGRTHNCTRSVCATKAIVRPSGETAGHGCTGITPYFAPAAGATSKRACRVRK